MSFGPRHVLADVVQSSIARRPPVSLLEGSVGGFVSTLLECLDQRLTAIRRICRGQVLAVGSDLSLDRFTLLRSLPIGSLPCQHETKDGGAWHAPVEAGHQSLH